MYSWYTCTLAQQCYHILNLYAPKGEGVAKYHIQQYFSYIVVASLLVEEPGVLGENHRFVASYWQTLSYNVVSSFSLALFIRSCYIYGNLQGRIQDFKLGGAHLKKLRRAEEGANIFGVFRVKNHYFTPKNHIFSNCGGRREHCWGISCEKSRFYAKKSYFLQF